MQFITVDYDKSVDRTAFDCIDHPALNQCIARQASQDQKRNVSRTFMYLDGRELLGYYTLATTTIKLDELDPATVAKLPKYPLPAVLLSRLAVDGTAQKKGIGPRLMKDVFLRIYAISKHAGVAFLAVDAKDERAAAFYEKLGFVVAPNNRLRLIMETDRFIRVLKDQEEAARKTAAAPAPAATSAAPAEEA
ncbi:GNAT family N-acetyltransferase [Pseudomonas aeruginosa]|uniref:GNAT family N-acetyltransferase n=1 Tax=Pseudomonas aeruginosa TaxID=287 RepID=UPI003F528BDD